MARQRPLDPLAPARKGNSFNDRLVLLVGVPVVLCWVAFACLVIWNGLRDDAVLDRVEEYGLLLAIIATPAMLILNSIVELWKTEQGNEIQMQPDQIRAAIEQGIAQADHQRQLSKKEQAHEQLLAVEAARHSLTGSIHGNQVLKPVQPTRPMGEDPAEAEE